MLVGYLASIALTLLVMFAEVKLTPKKNEAGVEDLRDKSVLLFAEETWNSRANRSAPRGSIVAARRLADDRLGVLFSAAWSRRYAVDAGKARRELGFEPSHTLETGIGSTVDWYLANDAWWRRAQDAEYRAWLEKHYGAAR